MKVLILALILMPLLISCSVPVSSQWLLSPGQSEIAEFRITEQGVSVNVENFKVGNMSPGRTVKTSYRIYNDTESEITPDIFPEYNVDPSRYSKAVEYSSAPVGLPDWLDIPECTPVPPGSYEDYPIILNIPKGATIDTEKWAFRVGAGCESDDFYSVAVSIWWLIDMR